MRNRYQVTTCILLLTGIFSLLACNSEESSGIILGSTFNNNSTEENTSTVSPDLDGDGLTALQETACGSNPTLVDTDGDQILDGAECDTYHTNPNLVDTDGDGRSDTQEIILDHTDPLNPDHDLDGYVPVANLGGWPAEADCDDNNIDRNPGETDTIGDLVDTDCKFDVATAHHVFPKGYNIDVELNSAGTGVFITTYLTAPGENHGETLVNPALPDIPDTQSGPDGCRFNSGNCAFGDYHNQPFGLNQNVGYVHESKSWDYCFSHFGYIVGQGYVQIPNNPACAQPLLLPEDIYPASYNLEEGVGFRVQKLGAQTFKVTAVGKRANNDDAWDAFEVTVGE